MISIEDRVLKLEVESEQRWKSHDTYADQRTQYIKEAMNEVKNQLSENAIEIANYSLKMQELMLDITKKFATLPCKQREIEIKSLKGQQSLQWSVIFGVIVVGIILGVWIRSIFS